MLFYENIMVGKKVKDGGLHLSGQRRKLAAKVIEVQCNTISVSSTGGCKKAAHCLLICVKKHTAP